jgi:ribosomal protein S27AE
MLIRPYGAEMATSAVPHNYKCPNLECRAEYFAIHRDYAPEEKPRCSECGTPFLAMEKGRYIHYQAAWNVVPLSLDQADDSF